MYPTRLITAALALLIAGAAVAQTAAPVVTERQAKQQAPIEGAQSGELAKGEISKLRAEQRAIRAGKRMAKADGGVTADERAKPTHDQKVASRKIYKQKHDAQKRE